MSGNREKACELLRQFKGDSYVFGLDCLDRIGALVADLGKRVTVVGDALGEDWARPIHAKIETSLRSTGLTMAGEIVPGARPNAPREDVVRIAEAVKEQGPDVVVGAGGGSTIDAAKAAAALNTLGSTYPDIEAYFGVGKVTEMIEAEGVALMPTVGVQFAASSAAHLTKYSNITDLETAQKKLIVDEAIVPKRALFDYAITTTMPKGFTADGGLDGVAHCLEVFYGLTGDALDRVTPIAALGIDLVVGNIKQACDDPGNLEARDALGLGTDLGGYAIMVGGTNGAHLTSFSLVDVLSHGRACALMNPYYTVFFAPAIEEKLRLIGGIFVEHGYLKADLGALKGRDLGLAVAEAMVALSRDIGFPTSLGEVPGFTDDHIRRALAAAKNPQLDMKLKAMPVPLSADTVDDYMGPILESAKLGDFSMIRNMN